MALLAFGGKYEIPSSIEIHVSIAKDCLSHGYHLPCCSVMHFYPGEFRLRGERQDI